MSIHEHEHDHEHEHIHCESCEHEHHHEDEELTLTNKILLVCGVILAIVAHFIPLKTDIVKSSRSLQLSMRQNGRRIHCAGYGNDAGLYVIRRLQIPGYAPYP